nr:basic proline-rich protein-like [Aegilops tauschii subsp. strangulata]
MASPSPVSPTVPWPRHRACPSAPLRPHRHHPSPPPAVAPGRAGEPRHRCPGVLVPPCGRALARVRPHPWTKPAVPPGPLPVRHWPDTRGALPAPACELSLLSPSACRASAPLACVPARVGCRRGGRLPLPPRPHPARPARRHYRVRACSSHAGWSAGRLRPPAGPDGSPARLAPPPPPSPSGRPAQVGFVTRLRLASHRSDLLPLSSRARPTTRHPVVPGLPFTRPRRTGSRAGSRTRPPTRRSSRLPASGRPAARSGPAPPAPAGSPPTPAGPGPAPSAPHRIRLPLCARGSARPPRFAPGRLRPRRADSARQCVCGPASALPAWLRAPAALPRLSPRAGWLRPRRAGCDPFPASRADCRVAVLRPAAPRRLGRLPPRAALADSLLQPTSTRAAGLPL